MIEEGDAGHVVGETESTPTAPSGRGAAAAEWHQCHHSVLRGELGDRVRVETAQSLQVGGLRTGQSGGFGGGPGVDGEYSLGMLTRTWGILELNLSLLVHEGPSHSHPSPASSQGGNLGRRLRGPV